LRALQDDMVCRRVEHYARNSSRCGWQSEVQGSPGALAANGCRRGVGLPVNLRNLKFDNMRISKEAQEGLSSLVIEGTIVSITNRPTEVPRPRFAARDAAGQKIYTWTAMPIRSILGPEEKLDFRSRFVSPPENAIDVMVRFSHAQDVAPATK
jgi:hypothetical protein